ncbi:hypothetical protein N9L68_04035 [bacterium]|nr:hypothetical protein [bacterium]
MMLILADLVADRPGRTAVVAVIRDDAKGQRRDEERPNRTYDSSSILMRTNLLHTWPLMDICIIILSISYILNLTIRCIMMQPDATDTKNRV